VRQSKLYDAIATVMSRSLSVGKDPAPEQEATIVTRYSLEEAKAHSRERLRRGHVLVAEDNQVNQKVAVRMLERLGYRADVSADGLEAVEALSRIPYAAVLMDVQMPEMDGYEATAEIRRREEDQGRHTPIIAMTASAMQGDMEKALEAGMDDYISKPVKREVLEAVLERWIPQEEAEPDGLASETSSGFEASEGAAIDHSALEDLRALQGEDEPDILKVLIELYLEEAPPRLAALREAIEGGDARTVERAAHTLKGSTANMGAMRMAAVCAELEKVGGSGELTRAPELLEQLVVEFDRARQALNAELPR
jgi:CheY-like chemotaxis protein/HPt (histidine-containing phosphotransfer) domain-containing protein